jgi:hypothetical protein
MPIVRPHAFRSARWVPYDGSPPVIPPDPPGGGGSGETPPPPGSGGTGMLVGAAASDSEAFDALNVQAGPWTVRRSYNAGAIPATWADSAAGPDVGRCASVWSAKPEPIAMAAGTLDTAVRSFLQSIPDSHTAFVTVWHEPDVKIKQQTEPYTAAQYRAALVRFCALVREVAKPHVYTALIVSDYCWINPVAGALITDLWPGNDTTGRPYVDVLAQDGYGNASAPAGEAMWGQGRAAAAAFGVSWGIGEVGFASDVTSGTSAATWMQTQADYAATHSAARHSGAAFLCWFNSAVGGVTPAPEAFPETIAKSAAISQQYHLPYTSFVL